MRPDLEASAATARRRGAALLLAAAGTAASTVGSCKGPDEVKLVLLDPCCKEAAGDAGSACFRKQAAYTELVVFARSCPSDAILAEGDTSDAVRDRIVPASSKPPAVGELSKKPYGFAVLLRDEACRVTAFGCTKADLKSIREVRVSVRAWPNGQDDFCTPLTGGGCEAPEACVAGRCVSEGGAADVVVPSDAPPDIPPAMGCTLAIVAGGDLPMPLTPNARLTGPGLVATPKGFVIGYREMSGNGWQITLLSLNDAGQLGSPAHQMTKECAGMEPSDGFGMAWLGSEGLAAVSDPDCGTGAGATFVQFDASAKVTKAQSPSGSTMTDLSIARTHSLAPKLAGTWELVYLSAGKALSLGLLGVAGDKLDTLFQGTDTNFVTVASSPMIRATLADLSGVGARLDVGPPASSSPNQVPMAAGEGGSVTAPWGALTAWSARAAAVIPEAGGGLLLKAVDVDGSDVGGGSLPGQTFTSADITALRDHLFVVGSKNASFTLYDVPGAASMADPPAAKTKEIATIPGATLMTGYDGQNVALAAGRQRVALAWIKQNALVGATSVGGWALLECGE